MGTIWVREFTGGLDARRLPETTAGGVLIRGRNGHINRGGEFEKRAAFVPTYSLPSGTVGMAAGKAGLYVFGHTVAPTMPTGVTYQRLQHPSSVALTDVLSVELFAGKLYVVAEFADGARFHFYDGTRVTDWYDGRARASFTITAGSIVPAVSATGSFEVTGGTANVANQITAVTIDGVNLISSAVTHTGNNATTAAAVAAAINSFTSSPDYTAAADGQIVRITASVAGTSPNGKIITTTVTGNFATSNATVMSGGAAVKTAALSGLTVDGVSVIGASVPWTTNAIKMAQDIADAINSYASTPEYTAVSSGATVSIVASATGSAANGKLVNFTVSNDLAFDQPYVTLANGSDATETYQPGTFVRTVKQKVYSVSGPNMHFSGIKQPTKWTTATVGAGFVDLSSEASGSEELVSIAQYQSLLAVFAERIVQVWFIDPDPTLYRQTQVLNNTGTLSPKSVTQFGDNDIFYLDESGLRSLRARDASNAAATTDIGVPVDPLITARLRSLTLEDRQRVTGLIEPQDGRFWLIMKDTIFVFSYFTGAKVSAWSTYTPSTMSGDTEVPFEISDAVVYRRRVYVRSGDTIYSYGGLGDEYEYDATPAEPWLPYLDAGAPTREKTWTGIDAAVQGTWSISAAMQPADPAIQDENIVTIDKTTFSTDRVGPNIGSSTHIGVRFRSVGTGKAVLSSVVVHYEGDANEDK